MLFCSTFILYYFVVFDWKNLQNHGCTLQFQFLLLTHLLRKYVFWDTCMFCLMFWVFWDMKSILASLPQEWKQEAPPKQPWGYHTTQHHIPEESNLQIPSCHLLLSHTDEVAYSNINHTLLCASYAFFLKPFSLILHLSPSSCTHDYSLPSLYSILHHHHTHKIVDRFRYTNN